MSDQSKNVLIKIAKLEELPIDSGKTVRCGGEEIALFRLNNGKVKAIQNRCPHKNGVLAEGIVSGDYVFCPLHDRKIDVCTGLVQAPDTGCVKTYQVVIKEEAVFIKLSSMEELVS